MSRSTSQSQDGSAGGVKTKKLVGIAPYFSPIVVSSGSCRAYDRTMPRADGDQRRGDVDGDLQQVVGDQERDERQQQGVALELAQVGPDDAQLLEEVRRHPQLGLLEHGACDGVQFVAASATVESSLRNWVRVAILAGR